MNNLPPLTSPPPSRSRWWVGGIVVLLVVGLVAWAMNSSQYLKTQVFTPTGDEEKVAAVPVDDYTVLETYCDNARQAHILECGYAAPEEDYHCRTEGAQAAFQRCMTETSAADARASELSEELAALDPEDPEYEEKSEALLGELEAILLEQDEALGDTFIPEGETAL